MKARIVQLLPAALVLVLTVSGIAVAADVMGGTASPQPDSIRSVMPTSDPAPSSADTTQDSPDDDGTPDRGRGDNGTRDGDDARREDRPARTEIREDDGRREVRAEVEHDGTDTYPAADAGSVTVTRDGATLTIDAVGPAAGWRHRVERASGREVEVTFRRDGRRIDFKVEIEGHRVEVRVREREA